MKNLRISVALAAITLLIFGIIYPAAMTGLAQLLSPHGAAGKPVYRDGALIGFENIGQSFDSPDYFWGRPSAVGYDASATGGSNRGASDPDLLQLVQSRIDTLLKYHPGIGPEDIPPDMVTASGSGLDPHISKAGALMQVQRIAAGRQMSEEKVRELIESHTQRPLLGILGPGDIVNVLKLNLALDEEAKRAAIPASAD